MSNNIFWSAGRCRNLHQAVRRIVQTPAYQAVFNSCVSRFQLVTGRTWRGTAFGGVKGRTELPGIVDDYLAGKMLVDEYVTHHTVLDDINKGFNYMHVSVIKWAKSGT